MISYVYFANIIQSNFSSASIRVSCICSIQVFDFFLIGVKGFVAFCNCLRFLCWFYPSLFFTMLLLSAMMIVRILFALTLPSFIWISTILPKLFNSLELLLLFFELLLLPFQLFLFFFLFFKFVSLLLLYRCIHV